MVMLAPLLCLTIGCARQPAATSPAVPKAPSQVGLAPFLTVPFASGTQYRITEGWVYSPEEQAIHHHVLHRAIDFAVPRGTEVLAPCDGYALASYHRQYSGEYQGKRIGFGLGHFVQMWLPDAQLFLQFGHLEKAAKDLPYFPPEPVGEILEPRVVYCAPGALVLSQMKGVKRGELIGYVGDSGLSWGYEETPQLRPDPKGNPSWDEVHLHFEIFRRNEEGRKCEWWDPYGVYAEADLYQDASHVKAIPLWLPDASWSIPPQPR